MFKLDPLRKWTDKVIKEIEDDQLRNIARAVYPTINYIFILILAGIGASVIRNITNMVVQVAKALATTR